MAPANWQLQHSIDAIIFDCDGTLSAIEGINQLAEWKGVNDTVAELTEKAMGKTGINPDLYQKRLALVQPTYDEVIALGLDYYRHKIANIEAILTIFKKLNKEIFIVSAGLQPAVALFAEQLQLKADNVFAVNITFDAKHRYLDFDHDSSLIHNDGKKKIILSLQKHYPNLLYVGDGLNDLAAIPLVKRFVGFGGAFYREQIAKLCQYYITDYLALLPLTLTAPEAAALTQLDANLYSSGLGLLTKLGQIA